MEPIKRNPQDIQPARRPDLMRDRLNGPAAQRGVFSDFAAHPRPQQAAPKPPVSAFSQATAPRPTERPAEPETKFETLDAPKTKAAREPHETGHSGWVGLTVFVMLTVIFLSPLLPGKVFQSFPGSSTTESTGEQTIGCIDDLKNVKTSTAYTSKNGFPIVYNNETNTTLSAMCDGVAKTTSAGQTSQFNPLGAFINIVLALVIALAVAKVWAIIFSPKKQKR